MVLVAGTCLIANADTWETLDVITTPDGPSGQVDDIAAADNGVLYAIGAALGDAGEFSANIVRRSDDGGVTWASLASFSPVSGNGFNKLALGPLGEVYAAGLYGRDWTVVRSLDRGLSWQTVDTFNLSGAAEMTVRGMATDPAGAVYVIGSASYSRGVPQWIVRKGVNSGTGMAWRTVDTYVVSKNLGAFAKAIAVKRSPIPGNAPEIYVGGTGQSASGQTWIVRRSLDGGANWSVLDFYPSGGFDGGAMTIAVAPDGAVYTSGQDRTVSGTKRNPVYTTSFVVRKGTPSVTAPGTFAWQTLHTVPETALRTALRPLGSVMDASGRVFFAGFCFDRTNNQSIYIVRASNDSGLSSFESDSFVGGNFCISRDTVGNIYAGGYFGSELPDAGGIIRRLPAPAQ